MVIVPHLCRPVKRSRVDDASYPVRCEREDGA